MAFAPPGLCPCWLTADPGHTHLHLDGHPERAHKHDYLFDLFQGQTSAAAPAPLLPISLLLALLAASGLWRQLTHAVSFEAGWNEPPGTPPPKRLAI
jgi:hypothetical protein